MPIVLGAKLVALVGVVHVAVGVLHEVHVAGAHAMHVTADRPAAYGRLSAAPREGQ